LNIKQITTVANISRHGPGSIFSDPTQPDQHLMDPTNPFNRLSDKVEK